MNRAEAIEDVVNDLLLEEEAFKKLLKQENKNLNNPPNKTDQERYLRIIKLNSVRLHLENALNELRVYRYLYPDDIEND